MTHTTTPQLTTREPRLLTFSAVLALIGVGMILFLPVLLTMLIVSSRPLGPSTFLLPLLVQAGTLFFLPFGFGNLRVTRLVRRLDPHAGSHPGRFVVQLTTAPRLRSGLRAALEDADDIGCLTVENSVIRFNGDAVQLAIPVSSVRELRRRNLGWKGCFLYGPAVVMQLADLGAIVELRFAERSSLLLPQSRRTARELFAALASAVGQARA